jgi:hypothetical protein
LWFLDVRQHTLQRMMMIRVPKWDVEAALRRNALWVLCLRSKYKSFDLYNRIRTRNIDEEYR